jgi:hypothetical protein
MLSVKRGALAVGVVGLMLSAGAAGFSASTPSTVRFPSTPCVAVETQFDLLEASNQGVNFAYWDAAERVALTQLNCPTRIIEGDAA